MSWAKQTQSRENLFYLLTIKIRVGKWQIRTNINPPSSQPLSSWAQIQFFVPDSSAPSSLPKWQRGMWNGGCSQFVTLHLCCSFLLMLFPCSRVRGLPQEIVLHTLLQHRSLPQGCSSSKSVSVCSSHGVTGPVRTWSTLGFPWGHSFLQAHPALQAHVLHTPQVDLCSTMDLCELWGTTCINGTLQRLQGTPWSSTWSAFFHSCSACSFCGVISLEYSHSPTSAAVVQPFFALSQINCRRDATSLPDCVL